MKTLYLKKGKEQSLLRFHQWIFSGALQPHDPPEDGEQVTVYSHNKKFIAWGYYNIGSISVKVLGFSQPEDPNQLVSSKIHRAFDARKELGFIQNPLTNCYRMIHGEGDGLPGLVADVYDKHIVLQIHHAGMDFYLPAIEKAMLSLNGLSPDTLVVKYVDKKNHNKEPKYLKGNATSTQVKENGITFRVDWVRGQKTGFFIDQRENRSLLKQYVSGKKVLNAFCYTGGFSLYAEKGGAAEVHSVDCSQWAMDEVQHNYILNDLHAVPDRLICGDALNYLHMHSHAFDVIVLDPPAFAKSMYARHNALLAYKRINKSAISQIKPGGIIFTFSCSQVVDSHMFRQAVYSAGIEAERPIRILHRLSQPADHPVNLFHPETEYLKGLVIMVE